MKRIIIFLSCALCIVHCAFSQGLMDASRMANTDIMGTARYMSMAGSMGALGGDPSAVLDNPAALGIYRSSELSFSLNATPSVTLATSPTNAVKQNDFFFNFNQLSYIVSLQTGRDRGYVSSNFSFTYNRLKDFHRQTSVAANGTPSMTNMIADFTNGFYPSEIHEDNLYAPYLSILGYQGYLMDPMNPDSMYYYPYASTTNRLAYKNEESGRIEEYNFSYSANVGHYLYIGAGIGLQTLNYQLISYSGEMYDNGASATLKNVFNTSGVGCNLRLGVIVRPASWMRVGASFQSPTWYSLSDSYYAKITGEGTSAEYSVVEYSTPTSRSSYNFNSPLKAQASLGFVLGKVALINVDYLYTHNRGMKFKGEPSDYLFAEPEFVYENKEIKDYSLSTHTIKAGAEFRIASQFSFRAGAAYRTPNLTDNATRTLLDNTTRTDMEVFVDKGMFYASGGFGYRYNGFGIDITYAYSQQNQAFSPFQQGAEILGNGYFGVNNPLPQTHLANIKTMRHNAVLTILYKF
jgi:hypothetical protein